MSREVAARDSAQLRGHVDETQGLPRNDDRQLPHSQPEPRHRAGRSPADHSRVTEDATRLAGAFLDQHALPTKAALDALHIAVAVVMGMDYVLTWNCTHIANAAIRPKLEDACRKLGYEPPVICTPEELME